MISLPERRWSSDFFRLKGLFPPFQGQFWPGDASLYVDVVPLWDSVETDSMTLDDWLGKPVSRCLYMCSRSLGLASHS